jgi:hypothetical protein
MNMNNKHLAAFVLLAMSLGVAFVVTAVTFASSAPAPN